MQTIGNDEQKAQQDLQDNSRLRKVAKFKSLVIEVDNDSDLIGTDLPTAPSTPTEEFMGLSNASEDLLNPLSAPNPPIFSPRGDRSKQAGRIMHQSLKKISFPSDDFQDMSPEQPSLTSLLKPLVLYVCGLAMTGWYLFN